MKKEKSKYSKNKQGQIPVFKTPEELQKACKEYFESCKPYPVTAPSGEVQKDKNGMIIYLMKPPTLSGLALALGFESRQSIYDYEKRERFSYTMKKARLTCERFAEEGSINGTIPPAVGIFILKNYGWRDDKHIHSDSTNLNFNYSDISEEELNKKLKEYGK